MSQIKPRPPYQKTAIMTEAEERKYMDSFRDSPCESCGVNDGTIVAAHLNMYMGGTGWRYRGVVVGLCNSYCHPRIDGSIPASWEERYRIVMKALQKLARDRGKRWKE